MLLSHSDTIRWIQRYRDLIADNVDELNKLDAAIGDGDFGASMQRGLNAVVAVLGPGEPDSIGKLLHTVGTTLVSAMGGTSGPLVGTVFTKMARVVGDVDAVEASALVVAFRAAADGVGVLGGAERGDKTMLDSLLPAVEAMEAVVGGDHTLQTVLHSAAEAARTGAERTIELHARKGRASYVGSGGVGCIDPGATGMRYMFAALHDVVGEGINNSEGTQ